MKPGIPWSIKGVEPELREVAKDAARRSGMTLGEWLNSAINEQADGAATTLPEPVAAPSKVMRGRISTHPIERAATRLEDIAEQLSRLAQRESETSPRYVAPQAEENGTFAKILSRVESNERQTVEAFSAVNERLALLGRQFSKAQPAATAKPEESPGFQALEKAVRNIVEHLEVSEKRTRENLKSLQDRIGDMTARANNSNNDQVLRQAPAFSQLENRLSELARRVEQNQQPQNLPDILRQELDELAGRIDTVRDSAETLANRAQTQAVQTAQAELGAIEQRILGLLKEAQSSISAHNVGPAEIQRFRSEIDNLNSRIDGASKGTASDRDVTALRVAVEQLSTRVAQGADPRPLAEMDRRILDITKKLELSQSQARDLPQLGELERRMAELDHRLEEALTSQHASANNDVLAQHLAVVNERLGKTEHQLMHLETIERAIGQLYDSMEQNRNWTREVAEEAAGRMGQQVLSQQPQTQPMPVSLAGSPEIMALEQGLHAVREASRNSDTRNQETLEAVHETLEQIVTKLAELETAAIGQRVAFAAAPPTAPVAMEDAVEQQMAAPLASVFGVEEPLAHVEPEAAPAPMIADLPPQPHLEIEPQNTLRDDGDNSFEAQAAIFNSATLFETLAPATPAKMAGEEAGPDDFIAAARRAAQAAVQQKSILAGISPSAAKLSEVGSRKLLSFKLPFRKSAKGSAAAQLADEVKLPPEIKAANSNLPMSKRTLILSGILALGVLAFIVTRNIAGPAPVPAPVAPVAVEQPTAAAPAAPAAAATTPAAQPVPAPLDAQPPAPAKLEQRGDNSSASDSDSILTGSLPATTAVKSPAGSDALDAAVGPDALRKAASTGDANAQFVIATRYLNGENVAPDAAKAAYWYGRAAATGLAPAQYRVATLYERGTGVDKNLETALSWYERAAALGNVKAMHNAAVIAAGNEAGGPDYAKAFKWFSSAASHGLRDSQFNLAVLYERGMGTTKDLAQALFWYDEAAAQDDPDAKSHAEVLAKSMPADIVKSTEAKVQTWQPEKTLDVANVVAINEVSWKGNSAPLQQVAATETATPIGENMVGTAQNLLEKLGYKVGQMDGKLGGRTANAIRLFQLQQGLKVTGEVTPELIAAMQSKTS